MLAGREPAFAAAIARAGLPAERISQRGFQTLLRAIVGQQVSVASADAMWRKLVLDTLLHPRAAARQVLAMSFSPGQLVEAAVVVTCVGMILGYAAVAMSPGAIEISVPVLDYPLLGALAQRVPQRGEALDRPQEGAVRGAAGDGLARHRRAGIDAEHVVADRCSAGQPNAARRGVDADRRIGDEAVLFGPGGPSALDVADAAGTIAYVLTSGLTARVPRCTAGE